MIIEHCKGINNMKNNVMLACALVTVAGASFGAVPVDVTDAITDIQTDLTSLVTSIIPAAVAVLAAAIGIWMIPRIVGALKRAFGAGGGR